MKTTLKGALVAALLLGAASSARAACPPPGWDEAALERLRAAKFELADPAARSVLANALTGCLADPRPQLRDGAAFEALSAWMRAGALPAAQLESLRVELQGRLSAEDSNGFGHPFAALVLSEIARVDRLKPFLEPPSREGLLRAAVAYETGIRDHRGFDATQGWRHGVAHGADLLLQLALNPALGREALEAVVAAVGTQVAPVGEHFYVYGESERLARPVYYAAQRGLHDSAWWSAWLATLAVPAPLPNWGEAFKTQAGLARKHNTQAFVQVLYVMVREGGNDALQQRLLPGLVAALKALP
ncbi:MAG: DUF2785 domain-containing protein [Burkholderiales bacterium]|nr:DUF2785 domain-containing protein [Burkholderiales bacterium]